MSDTEPEEVDAIGFIGSLLQTEDGETIPDVLKSLVAQLEMQNKILVKMLSALKNSERLKINAGQDSDPRDDGQAP